jgi:hypothetical protein
VIITKSSSRQRLSWLATGDKEAKLRVRLSSNPFWAGTPVPDATDCLKSYLRAAGLPAGVIDTLLCTLAREGMADIDLPQQCDLRALAEAVPSLTIELPDP